MNIRKQLNDLKKDEREHYGKLAEEDRKVMIEVVSETIETLEHLLHFESTLPSTTYNSIKTTRDLLSKLRPDPKGDISNVGRDKLDEFAARNQITPSEKPTEEKVLSTIASKVLGGNDD